MMASFKMTVCPRRQSSLIVPCYLSGVMVSVLAIGPKVRRFKPNQGNGFLRVIKFHSTPSFGGEVKLEAPCHKILWHVKKVASMDRNTSQG
jgi:hypothetical protein